MSAKVPQFGQIGATAKEVLTGAKEGVYQYNTKLSFSTRTKDGVDFTSTVIQSGDKTAETALKAVYKVDKLNVSGTANQNGKIILSAGQTNITPGLSWNLTGTYPDIASGKLGIDYYLPHVSLKSTIGLTNPPTIDAAITTGDPHLFAGADASFSGKTNTITKWTVGAGVTQKEWQAGVLLMEKGEVIKATYAHAVNPALAVAGEVIHNISKNDSTAIVIGAQKRLDNGALVKARVDSDSVVSLHWEGSVHPNTVAGVSLQVNARDFESPPRLGFAASAVS